MDITSIVQSIIIALPGLVVAITLHEAAHGFVASKYGDDTARHMGRLTLNPISHIDPFGTILLPIIMYIVTGGRVPVGYAKPVPVNPFNLNNPKRDMIFVSAAGPATNIAIGIIAIIILDLFWLLQGVLPEFIVLKIWKPIMLMLIKGIYINVFIAAFNLIPVPPLDGGRILAGLLPRDLEEKYSRIEPYGFFIVIGLLYIGLAQLLIIPLVILIMSLINILNITPLTF